MGSLVPPNSSTCCVGGLAVGCVYSLSALGFAMIMRATNIIHFARAK
jgi:branched-chain amino acid transport system permease protein